MARTGRFGRLPAAAQDLSSTIQSMLEQYESARDRNIEVAWRTPGAKFEGKKVTDDMFLKWWEDRAAEVSRDDPMWDYYQQALASYKFQIAEEKVNLRHKQGKIGERTMARWYEAQAAKVPKNSAAWRDLMLNAANFRKAAARSRSGANSESAFKNWLARYEGLRTRNEKPADVIASIVDQVAGKATGQINIWSISTDATAEGGEYQDFNTFLANIEDDPNWSKPGGWRDQLMKADPGFHGTLTMDYVTRKMDTAKRSTQQRAAMARKKGYSNYEQSANNDGKLYGDLEDAYELHDDVVQVGKWITQAQNMGLTGQDINARETARAWLADKLSRKQKQLENRNDYTAAGRVQETIYQITGDPRGENVQGIAGGAFGTFLGENQTPAAGGFEQQLLTQAQKDNADRELLGERVDDGTGRMVPTHILEVDPVTGSTTVRPREQLGNSPEFATLPTQLEATTYTGRDGKKVTKPGFAITNAIQGTPVYGAVPMNIDPKTGTILTTFEPGQADSALLAYEFKIGGRKVWKVYSDDGPRWTYDNPFVTENVIDRREENGQIILYIDPNTAGSQGTETVTSGDETQTNKVGRARSVLDPQYGGGVQEEDKPAPGPDTSSNVIKGVRLDDFSEEQRAAFGKLSPTNQRFLIDRGLTAIPVSEMNDGAIDKARGGGVNLPTAWRPRKRRAGVDDTIPAGEDMAGHPRDPAERARRNIALIESQLDEVGWRSDETTNEARRQSLLAERQRLLDDPGNGLTTAVKDLYKRKLDGRTTGAPMKAPRSVPENERAQWEADRKKGQQDYDKKIQDEIDDRVQNEPPGGSTDPYTDPQQTLTQLQEHHRTLQESRRQLAQGISSPVAGPFNADGSRMTVADMDREIKASQEAIRTQIGGSRVLSSQLSGAFYGGSNTGGAPLVTVKDVDQRVKGNAAANSYASYTALFYSEDEAHRKDLAKMSYLDVINLEITNNPDIRPGQSIADDVMAELRLVYQGANWDNATFTSQSLQQQGVPSGVADSLTNPIGYSNRIANLMGRDQMRRDGTLGPEEEEDPEGTDTDIDDDDDADSFMHGGGRPKGKGHNLGQLRGMEGEHEVYDPTGGATDRPALKLPNWGITAGIGKAGAGLTAHEAAMAQERLAYQKAQSQGSRAMYDPQARRVAPMTGSRARPQPEIKVAAKPKEAAYVRPEPKQSSYDAKVAQTRAKWKATPTKLAGVSKYDLVEMRDDRPY